MTKTSGMQYGTHNAIELCIPDRPAELLFAPELENPIYTPIQWIEQVFPILSKCDMARLAGLNSFPFIYSKGQYIVSGSDDGSFFIWEKETTNLVRILQGDESIVNCLQPHPNYCFLATSGIDPVVRLWNPRPEVSSWLSIFTCYIWSHYCFCPNYLPKFQTDSENGRVVADMEGAAQANQRRMNADPLEVMLLNMGYRITGLRGVGPDGSDDEDSSEGQVQCRPS